MGISSKQQICTNSPKDGIPKVVGSGYILGEVSEIWENKKIEYSLNVFQDIHFVCSCPLSQDSSDLDFLKLRCSGRPRQNVINKVFGVSFCTFVLKHEWDTYCWQHSYIKCRPPFLSFAFLSAYICLSSDGWEEIALVTCSKWLWETIFCACYHHCLIMMSTQKFGVSNLY